MTPHAPYFAALNAELKAHGPMRPVLLIDLDALDHNIDTVTASVARVPGRALRVVEKSLPSPKLLDYILKRAGTLRLMSFHQPFLNQSARHFHTADLLLGKPLPVRSAARFYREHQGAFDPARQLQWLIDTPARAAQYRDLAAGLGTVLNLNIELDVGLHRGGVGDLATLDAILRLIAAHAQQLRFSGFMGYDPFVAMLPRLLGTPQALLSTVMAKYAAAVEHVRREHPNLWREGLTLNTAGSPTYRLHEAETLSNDLSVGTGLLKPSHYDLATLQDHRPAVFIATPVLKSTGAVRIPALTALSRLWARADARRRQSHFLYGGYWMADTVSPTGQDQRALWPQQQPGAAQCPGHDGA